SEAEVEKAVSSFMFDPGKRWIFVPHFTFAKTPAEAIAAREENRQIVDNVSKRLGQEILDTSDYISSFDRTEGLAPNRRDIYHYAQDFVPKLAMHYHDFIFSKSVAEDGWNGKPWFALGLRHAR